MARESLNGVMDEFIMDTTHIIRRKVTVNCNGLTVGFTKVTGIRVDNMEKAVLDQSKVNLNMVNGTKEKESDGLDKINKKLPLFVAEASLLLLH